jgi:hypothetical protein
MSSDVLTPAQIERFVYLIEECSEVIKASTKLLRHGFYASDFSTGKEVKYNNQEDIEREIVDVFKAINRLIEAGDISDSSIINAMNLTEGQIFNNDFFHHQDEE